MATSGIAGPRALESVLTATSHISIAHLSPQMSNPSSRSIKVITTLIWPYSSSRNSITLLVAEPDFRLRRRRGQIRVEFSGPAAKAVARTGLGSGDEIILALEGARFEKDDVPSGTPGRGSEWELRFTERLVMQINRETEKLAFLDIDHPTPSPERQVQSPTSPRSAASTQDALPFLPKPLQPLSDEWSSPAFFKRPRLSSGSFPAPSFDPFMEEDGSVSGKGRKKPKFTRHSGEWIYADQSQSSEGEENVDEVMQDVQDIGAYETTGETQAAIQPPWQAQAEVIPRPLEAGLGTQKALSTTPPIHTSVHSAQDPPRLQEIATEPRTLDSPNLEPVPSPLLPEVSPIAMRRNSYYDPQSHFDYEQFAPGPSHSIPENVYQSGQGFTLTEQPHEGMQQHGPQIYLPYMFGNEGTAPAPQSIGADIPVVWEIPGPSDLSQSQEDFSFSISYNSEKEKMDPMIENTVIAELSIIDTKASLSSADPSTPQDWVLVHHPDNPETCDEEQGNHQMSGRKGQEMASEAPEAERKIIKSTTSPAGQISYERVIVESERGLGDMLEKGSETAEIIEISSNSSQSSQSSAVSQITSIRIEGEDMGKVHPVNVEPGPAAHLTLPIAEDRRDVGVIPQQRRTGVHPENQGLVRNEDQLMTPQATQSAILSTIHSFSTHTHPLSFSTVQLSRQTSKTSMDMHSEQFHLASPVMTEAAHNKHNEPLLGVDSNHSDHTAAGPWFGPRRSSQQADAAENSELKLIVEAQPTVEAETGEQDERDQAALEAVSSSLEKQQEASEIISLSSGERKGAEEVVTEEIVEESVEKASDDKVMKVPLTITTELPIDKISNLPTEENPVALDPRDEHPQAMKENPWFGRTRRAKQAAITANQERPTEGSISPPTTAKLSSPPIKSTQSQTSGSPPSHAELQQTRRGFRTPIAYFSPLTSLRTYYGNSIETFGIISSVTTAEKSKKGPKDWHVQFHITSPALSPPASSASNVPKAIRVSVFRPYKKALPLVKPGDGVLLRNFVVKSNNRDVSLLSGSASAYCVFGDEGEVVNGPPVEIGEEERAFVGILRRWWSSLDGDVKEKLAEPATREKSGAGKRSSGSVAGLIKGHAGLEQVRIGAQEVT
ncbi:MAG: hypothetical protein M1824_001323 [Vezdaea acicularis]|nr:MAG: hypothetical protein M1824_001323 [Vezdaea acicularis]